jgi:uncharacterized protein
MATNAEDSRIVTLDTVRGIAVMGILAMNIVAFAMPFPAYTNPSAWGGDTGIDLVAWYLNFIFVDGKMRGLFSILFGASTLLVIDRATRSGRGGAGAHYARMAVLLLFGCLHFYFLWFGDILALYALSGMVLYFFRKKSPKSLVRWAVGFIGLSMAFYGLIAWTAAIAGSPNLDKRTATELMEARRTVEQEVGAKSPKIQSDLKLYKSDYATIVDNRLNKRTVEPFASFLSFGLETLGLMFIGMALFKTGFLTGAWDEARYRKWLVRCSLISIPILALLGLWVIRSNFDAALVFGAFIAMTPPFDTLMAIAWAALVILWVKQGGVSALRDRVGATGRMAFTNYLATSAVMTTIFYGYGLNLFGEVGRAALWLFVLGMCALMLLWSKPWLDRFHYGPMEWLWRSMARGKLQPLRKHGPAQGAVAA